MPGADPLPWPIPRGMGFRGNNHLSTSQLEVESRKEFPTEYSISFIVAIVQMVGSLGKFINILVLGTLLVL